MLIRKFHQRLQLVKHGQGFPAIKNIEAGVETEDKQTKNG